MTSQLQRIEEIVVRETVPSSETVRDRFGAIDGLRALAILAVLAYEISRLLPTLVNRHAIAARVAADASQGFTLFAILSGFSLAYPVLVAKTENGRAYLDLGRFIVKRLLRVYPAYLLALGLSFIVPFLALRYGLQALAGTRAYPLEGLWRDVVFAGNGMGNDGFIALGIVVRAYLAFPLLLLLWARSRPLFALAALGALALDLTTALHGVGIGALVPFALGIVAAEFRAQRLPAYRFGIPLALVTSALAIAFGPALARLAASHASEALRIDPLWSLALFGLVVTVGALDPLERLLSLAPLRLLGTTAYAISLVVVPVSSFAVSRLARPFGDRSAAIEALVASLTFGFILYRLVDRLFAEDGFRRDVAARLGPSLDRILAFVRADRIVVGEAPSLSVADEPDRALEVAFYAPPPRPEDRAVVSRGSGSAEELAAEILATKQRLSERTSAFFAEPAAVVVEETYEQPGFYRKPKSIDAPLPRRGGIKMRIEPTHEGAARPMKTSADDAHG
ncbi:MAG: hypothetical protein NVSMB21_24090 [Vulcanimicrobiaceae bacterium]